MPTDRLLERPVEQRSEALWPMAVLILVGAVLRFYRLGANSLWFDEVATLAVAGHTPGEIMRISSSVNFIPPLYFLMVHGTLRILGESEMALRWISAVAGVGTIPVVWLLTEAITRNRSTANIAGGLLAVNPLHLWFSQEARPYALLVFLGCCGLLALARVLHHQRLCGWIAFSICGVLTVLTHTTGLLFGVIAWAWALGSSHRSRILRPLVASSLAIGLACAPALIAIAGALGATHMTFHSAPRPLTGMEVPYTLLTYVTGYSFGAGPRDIQNFGALAALQSHPFQTALAGATLLAVLVAWWVTRRRAMVGFLALFIIPLAGILALSALSGKAYNVRYTLPALIGFVGLVSMAAHALNPRTRSFLLTAVFGVALWADGQWFWSSRYSKEDSRAAVAWLCDNLGPGSTVAVAADYGVEPLGYYAHKSGAELRLLPVRPGVGLADGTTYDALVLTRLHHVSHWPELKARFLALVGDRVQEGRVAGYEMLVRPGGEHRIGGCSAHARVH